MFFRKKHKSQLSGPIPDYWVSISDLMSGLLLVFMLLLIVAMFHYAKFTRQREMQVEKRDQILKEQEIRLVAFEEKKRQLIEALKASLERVNVQVDALTGVVRVGEGILFEEDRADLRPEGKRALTEIYRQYIAVILDPKYRKAVDRIMIEGHTNSRGTYLHNLNLSQQRANTVMRTWLDLAGANQSLLQKKIVASGRSFADLVYLDNGQEDRVRSRRIEIAFRLKESDLMKSVYEQVKGHQP